MFDDSYKNYIRLLRRMINLTHGRGKARAEGYQQLNVVNGRVFLECVLKF